MMSDGMCKMHVETCEAMHSVMQYDVESVSAPPVVAGKAKLYSSEGLEAVDPKAMNTCMGCSVVKR